MVASGILNVDKEKGLSSHDVVALVRRGVRGVKVGHAGTLDPLATGVLVILVGQAVRISEFVMDLPKEYRTTITLGVATTTYDAEGDVTARHPVSVSEQEAREKLQRFVGEIEQAPPPYSAVKVEGERSYRLARKGAETSPSPRMVSVERIDLLRFDPPELEVLIECGKGAYVRSIAHDLGQELGCGAHVSELRRTRVGPFEADSAVPVERLRDLIRDGGWEDYLRPTDIGLMHLPALTVEIEDEKDLRHGQPIAGTDSHLSPPADLSDGLLVRGYAEDGSLIGILSYDATARLWRPRKVFG